MYHSIKKLHKLKNVVILLLIETCTTVEIESISQSHICFVISISNRIVWILQRKICERRSLPLKDNLERFLQQDGAPFLLLCSVPGHPLAELNTQMLPVPNPVMAVTVHSDFISAQKCLAGTPLLFKFAIIKFQKWCLR